MTLKKRRKNRSCFWMPGLRPNYHHLEERVEAHIFITLLAYHLLTWVRQKLADAGETRG